MLEMICFAVVSSVLKLLIYLIARHEADALMVD